LGFWKCQHSYPFARRLIRADDRSYQAIAKKYAGQSDAEAKLVGVVLKGGKSSWADNHMPAAAGVGEAVAKTSVTWIVATK